MQAIFSTKQIVWAKVKGYPWWPAEIAKLPNSEANVFKVVFVAEDTHAFLQPRDVKKFAQFYDEFSKKKMRGLVPAIQVADELYRKRTQSEQKNRPSTKGKTKLIGKTKIIKKQIEASRKVKNESSEIEDQVQSVEQQIQQNQKQKVEYFQLQKVIGSSSLKNVERQDSEQDYSQIISEGQSVQDEKFMMESEERVDRLKIEGIEEILLKIIQQIKHNTYKFNIETFKQLNNHNLTGQELLQSKITNMLSYILQNIKKQEAPKEVSKDTHKQTHSHRKDSHNKQMQRQKEDIKWLIAHLKLYKDRILDYLNDTTYYDQYLRLIQKNKKNRFEYENKLITYLKTNYKIKKELSILFASKIITEINNGTIAKQKQLLDDIKEKKIQISNITNKIAIERNIENMIAKYM